MAKTAKKPVSKQVTKKPLAIKKVTPISIAKPAPKEHEVVTVVNGYKLVRGIELPPSRRGGSGSSIYPLSELDVGLSFFEPASIDESGYTSPQEAKKAQSEFIALKHNRLSGAIRRYVKRNPETKFSARIVRDAKKYGYEENIGIIVQRIS